MPKTAVHKNDRPVTRKHEIGTSWEIAAVQPEPEAQTMHKPTNLYLRKCVLIPDAPHIFAAALG